MCLADAAVQFHSKQHHGFSHHIRFGLLAGLTLLYSTEILWHFFIFIFYVLQGLNT